MAESEFRAYLKVEDYDDDFCLLFDARYVPEGTRTAEFRGKTAAAALYNLLVHVRATDRHQRFAVTERPPRGYQHVAYVREKLDELCDAARRGRVDHDELYWGGNWNVRFVVEEIKDG